MDHRDTVVIDDHSDFQRIASPRGPDEHRHVRIVCFEGSPVVSNCVQHVVIVDAVPAGCRLDVHPASVRTNLQIVNMC